VEKRPRLYYTILNLISHFSVLDEENVDFDALASNLLQLYAAKLSFLQSPVPLFLIKVRPTLRRLSKAGSVGDYTKLKLFEVLEELDGESYFDVLLLADFFFFCKEFESRMLEEINRKGNPWREIIDEVTDERAQKASLYGRIEILERLFPELEVQKYVKRFEKALPFGVFSALLDFLFVSRRKLRFRVLF